MLKCLKCGHEEENFLGDHILEAHGMTVAEFRVAYPGAEIISPELQERFNKKHPSPKRAQPPKPEDLKVDFGGFQFPVHIDVPSEACLPMPENYSFPEYGDLHEDVNHALVALHQGRSTYIWGLPGSGKDALFHAWSALTRTPCLLKQIKPGTDIESWFFSRGFNEAGTYWEEGAVLKALRDGYTTASGEVIPYLLLVSDFDRADREQAEHMRLITDSIQGRIDGPAGVTYKVLPGTRIVATGNTAGSGDDRGRMISANPIDASLLDRFERKFQFHWMDWKDEERIARSKFPILTQRCPEVFEKMGKITEVLRKAILNGELYAEFSHRGVCAILGHTQDILACQDTLSDQTLKIPRNLLKQGVRAWIDGLPDQENRDIALKLMSAHVSMIVEGNTDHINKTKTLINGF